MASKYPCESGSLGFTIPMDVPRPTQPDTSSEDPHNSPEYDSDGCSFGSEDSKNVDRDPRHHPPHRKRRRTSNNRRRRSPIPKYLLEYATDQAPPVQPPPPPMPPPVQPQLDKFQTHLAKLKTRMAALEAEYAGLHVAFQHLSDQLQTLQTLHGYNSSPPDGSHGPSDPSAH